VVRRTGLLVLLAAPVTLGAQGTATSERVTETGQAPWITAWSPLVPLAEHPRALPALGAGSQLLVAPAPRIGLAWFARQAAALPLEMNARTGDTSTRFSELRLRGAGERGDYRRPLDAPTSGVWQGAGLGWRALGTRGAGIGRVVVDQERQAESGASPRVAPYTSSPFVIADTLSPETRSARARLEGMAGWRVMGFGLGLATGVETRELRSIDAPLRRSGRATRQGVTAGLARALPWAGLTLGAHARWQGTTENVAIVPRPGSGVGFAIQGYAEPDSLVIDLNSLTRRIVARADAAGLGARARVLGADVVAYGETTRRRERHIAGVVSSSPRERWDADGSEWGVAAQRALWASRALVTTWVRGSTLEGDAHRPDLTGIILTGRESRLAIMADGRLHLPGSAWRFGAQGGTTRETVARSDYVASLATDIVAWSPSASVEVARDVGSRGALAVTLLAGQHATTSRVPASAEQGPVYREYIAPELALAAGGATLLGGGVTGRWRLRNGTWWASLRGESLTPMSARLAASPDGHRTMWSMTVGMQP
jgi:hypothetical protein